MVANRKGAQFRISEIYGSVQGEGLLTGTTSTFIRTSGCNLRCWFCDTRFASWEPEGTYLDVVQIMEQVEEIGNEHIVLTGGEPMVYKRIGDLARAIVEAGKHLTIETAGTIFHEIPCSLFSISPKLSSSAPPDESGSWPEIHEARRERLDVVRRMMKYPYQLKFVIDSPDDTAEVLSYLGKLSAYDPSRVLLMPQGTDVAQLESVETWLKSWCDDHGFVFCPREHIRWFGNRRGT